MQKKTVADAKSVSFFSFRIHQEMEMEKEKKLEVEIKITEENVTVLSCYLDKTSSPNASIRKSGKLY